MSCKARLAGLTAELQTQGLQETWQSSTSELYKHVLMLRTGQKCTKASAVCQVGCADHLKKQHMRA